MRAKTIQEGFAIPATAQTANGTTLDLSVHPQDAVVAPGSSCVLAIQLLGAKSTPGDLLSLQTSNDGGTTWQTAASYALTGSAESRMFFIGSVLLGQQNRLSVTTSGTNGAGTVNAYILKD